MRERKGEGQEMVKQDVFQELLDEVRALRSDLKAAQRGDVAREQERQKRRASELSTRFFLSHRVGDQCLNLPGPF